MTTSRFYCSVALCALLWGSAFPCIKTVYNLWGEVDFFTRWWLAGIRFTLAGALLLLFAHQPMAQLRATPIRYTVGIVLCQCFFQYIFFYLALLYGSGSLCALMTATGSFLWLLLAPLFNRGSWGGWKVWGILTLGSIGVGLAVYAPSDTSVNAPLCILLMLLANLCGTLAILLFGKIRPTMTAKASSGFGLFIGGLGLCLLGSPALPDTPQLFTPPVIGITVYLALVSAISFTVWNDLSTRYPISLLATYRFIIPIAGVILSVLFIPEDHFSLWILLGTIIVALAMYLASKGR